MIKSLSLAALILLPVASLDAADAQRPVKLLVLAGDANRLVFYKPGTDCDNLTPEWTGLVGLGVVATKKSRPFASFAELASGDGQDHRGSACSPRADHQSDPARADDRRFDHRRLGACLPGLVMADPAGAKSGRHLFILSGQSNMRAPLPQSFEETVSKVFGKENVTVVTHSHPSQPIRQWYKKWTPPDGSDFQLKEGEANGVLYDKLLENVRKKAGDQTFATVTFVWMQGEADGQSGWGAVYGKSFLGIIDQLKADLKRDDIRFVLGRINDHRPNGKHSPGKDAVRQAQVKLGEENANGTWVDTDDLNAGINPWSVYEAEGEHFPNPGYRTLGQRFAREACKLIDPRMKVDATLFDAHFFNTVDEIATHAAVGRKTIGTAPDATQAGLSALTDGAYNGDDAMAKGWVAFAPEQKTVELMIDLGKPQKVTAIAANILINHPAGVGFPAKAHIATSGDGKTYEALPTRHDGGFVLNQTRSGLDLPGAKARLVVFDLDRPDVRYVKVSFNLSEVKLFLDEIIVNPQPRLRRN